MDFEIAHIIDEVLKCSIIMPVIGKNEKVLEALVHVYTHGSWMNGSTAFAFCAFQGDQVVYEYKSFLRMFNTVFQAELQAIVDAMNWAHERKYKTVNIYSDSQSSIIAMSNIYTRNRVVRDTIEYIKIIKKRRLDCHGSRGMQA